AAENGHREVLHYLIPLVTDFSDLIQREFNIKEEILDYINSLKNFEISKESQKFRAIYKNRILKIFSLKDGEILTQEEFEDLTSIIECRKIAGIKFYCQTSDLFFKNTMKNNNSLKVLKFSFAGSLDFEYETSVKKLIFSKFESFQLQD